jgi:hypothetical protein
MTFLMKILQGLMLKHVYMYILLILNFPLNMQAAIFPQIISWFRSPLMPNEQFFLARLW